MDWEEEFALDLPVLHKKFMGYFFQVQLDQKL